MPSIFEEIDQNISSSNMERLKELIDLLQPEDLVSFIYELSKKDIEDFKFKGIIFCYVHKKINSTSNESARYAFVKAGADMLINLSEYDDNIARKNKDAIYYFFKFMSAKDLTRFIHDIPNYQLSPEIIKEIFLQATIHENANEETLLSVVKAATKEEEKCSTSSREFRPAPKF